MEVIKRRTWGATESEKKPMFLRKPVTYVICAYSRRDIMSGGKLRLGTIPENFMEPRPKTLAPKKGSSDIEYIKALQRLQHSDMRRSEDIRYNFIIDPEGRVYKGRGWTYVPALPSRLKQFTHQSIYIGYLGTLFDDPPGKEVLDAKTNILIYGVKCHFLLEKFVERTMRHVFNKPIIHDIIALP